MQEAIYIESIEQAMVLLKPVRLALLQRMATPHTCHDLAQSLDDTPQKIYYHIKALEQAGLVEKIDERRGRGRTESRDQATARTYWLAPRLINAVGGKRTAQDQTSLRVLLSLAEEVQADVGRLAQRSEAGSHVPSLSLSAQIHLPNPNRRAEFLQELQTVFQALARKYGLPGDDLDDNRTTVGESFRLVFACYPQSAKEV